MLNKSSSLIGPMRIMMIPVRREDVDRIMSELEVMEDEAVAAMRAVANEILERGEDLLVKGGDQLVKAEL